jgi:hypothetical protein
MLIVSATSYAVAPAGAALGAAVASIASKPGHESIEGRVQGSGVTVRVVNGKGIVIGTTKVGRNGRFDVPVAPGAYKLIIIHGSKHVVKSLKVTSGHSAFVVVKVTQTDGGLGIAPVIFNY